MDYEEQFYFESTEILENFIKFKLSQIDYNNDLLKYYNLRLKRSTKMFICQFLVILLELSTTIYFAYNKFYIYSIIYLAITIVFCCLFSAFLNNVKRDKDSIKRVESDNIQLENDISKMKETLKIHPLTEEV